MALVDLASILPSLLPGGVLDLRFVRAVRLLRLSRSMKIARYSQSMQTLGRVLRAKRHELAVTAFAGAILLISAASGMYFVEHEAQPNAFSSIPAALWWGVVTLTTVGYGDVYPVTLLGRCLASVIAILGIGLFALPAGILAGGFAEELHRNDRVATCPNCGLELKKGA
jgi:voltage-gated potassium channel